MLSNVGENAIATDFHNNFASIVIHLEFQTCQKAVWICLLDIV